MITSSEDTAQSSVTGNSGKARGTIAASANAMQRADELLRQMTVEEKAMQMSSVFPLALFTTKGVNHRAGVDVGQAKVGF